VTTTTDQLREKYTKTFPAGVYDGMPIVELGDGGEWLMTFGRVDKAEFVKACGAWFQDTCGGSLSEAGVGSPGALIADTRHRKAQIVHLEEFPSGDYEVRFDEGDVDVTVLAVG
jgi:hypothetical protein